MFRNRLFYTLKTAYRTHKRTVVCKIRNISPVTLGLLATVRCEGKKGESSCDCEDKLSHEYLIRQATTVNVNAATQLLTVTVLAIQDTSEKLREALSREICLVQQATDWGDCTPPEHWDELVAIRHTLCDLKHNLKVLCSYMSYAEKLATTTAEISYMTGNIGASDAICERIEQANRAISNQHKLNQALQQESLDVQKKAILCSPKLEDKIKKY